MLDNMEDKKICVVGPGGVGGFIGHLLALGKVDGLSLPVTDTFIIN